MFFVAKFRNLYGGMRRSDSDQSLNTRDGAGQNKPGKRSYDSDDAQDDEDY